MALTALPISIWHSNNNLLDPYGGNNGTAFGATFDTVNQILGSACVNFDGVDDYIDIGDTSDVDFGAGDFSFVFWMKKALNNQIQILIGKDTGIERQFLVTLESNNKMRILYFKAGLTVVYQDTNDTITDTNWHFIVTQKISGVFKVWIDNVDITLGALGGSHGTMQSTTAPLRFGNRALGGVPYHYSGKLDEILIFNRGISSDEISYLWNGGIGRQIGLDTFNKLGRGLSIGLGRGLR